MLKKLIDSITREDLIGIVNAGGGSKGSYEIGVDKQIHDMLPYQPHVYLGTSTGAINAVGMAFNGVDATLEDWRSIKSREDIFTQATAFDFISNLAFGREMDGINDWLPLYNRLYNFINGKIMRTEAIITKVNLNTGALHHQVVSRLPNANQIALATVASAAVPGHTKPVDYKWVDGGVREQTPLKKAIEFGCTVIFVVLSNPWTIDPIDQADIEILPKRLRWVKIILRTLDIISHEIMINDLNICAKRNSDPRYKKIKLIVYAPKKLLHDGDTFDPKDLNNAIELGLKDKPIFIEDGTYHGPSLVVST